MLSSTSSEENSVSLYFLYSSLAIRYSRCSGIQSIGASLPIFGMISIRENIPGSVIHLTFPLQ